MSSKLNVILKDLEREQLRGTLNFVPGDTLRVHVKISEGDKERIQVFEGVVIAIRKAGVNTSFTVRKVSYGVGVERVFPLHTPAIDKIEVLNSSKVRRAKLYYLRARKGKAARLKDLDFNAQTGVTAGVPAPVPEIAGDLAPATVENTP